MWDNLFVFIFKGKYFGVVNEEYVLVENVFIYLIVVICGMEYFFYCGLLFIYFD